MKVQGRSQQTINVNQSHLISSEIYSGPRRTDDLTFGQAVLFVIGFILIAFLLAFTVTPTPPDNQAPAAAVSAQQ